MEVREIHTVFYTEPHPDREQTFLGSYSSPELAEAAINPHCDEHNSYRPISGYPVNGARPKFTNVITASL